MQMQMAPRLALLANETKFEGLGLAAFRLVESAPVRQWPP